MHSSHSHLYPFYIIAPLFILFCIDICLAAKKSSNEKCATFHLFCALHIFCATLDRHHLHLLLCETMLCVRDFARRLLQTGWHHSKSSRPPLRTTKTKIGGWMEEPPFRLLPSVVWIVGIRELGLIFHTKDSKQHHHSSSDSQGTRAQLISPSSPPNRLPLAIKKLQKLQHFVNSTHDLTATAKGTFTFFC